VVTGMRAQAQPKTNPVKPTVASGLAALAKHTERSAAIMLLAMAATAAPVV